MQNCADLCLYLAISPCQEVRDNEALPTSGSGRRPDPSHPAPYSLAPLRYLVYARIASRGTLLDDTLLGGQRKAGACLGDDLQNPYVQLLR